MHDPASGLPRTLLLHPGTSELDNVPYIKTPGPGHLLVSRIPYPLTRTTVLLLFALGRRVAAVAGEFPAKLALFSGSQMPAFTVPTSKEYRTLPQNMTYPATKLARNVPAKLGKYVGERSERPVCVYC